MTKRQKTTNFIFGADAWQRFFPSLLPDQTFVHLDKGLKEKKFVTSVLPKLMLSSSAHLYVWSFQEPRYLKRYRRWLRNPVGRLEDGFIRSVKLGRMGEAPLSMCIDSRGIYFDPSCPSDLEHIYATYDFDADADLITRARNGIAALTKSRLSKYNLARSASFDEIYGAPTRKRILVVGQVERDMSILKGCTPARVNLDLVKLARDENPDADVYYKPHPEVLHKTREGQSDPREAERYSTVLYEEIPLADVFDAVDHVYTITSLAGFEAMLRGLPVTCLGAPFYSGWGLTDDRQPVARRNRTLTIEQLFAGAYLLYPTYMDPETGQRTTYEKALALLQDMKAKHDAQSDEDLAPVEADQVDVASETFRNGGSAAATHAVPIFGINLDREPQRWDRLSKRANELGLAVKRVPAVDRMAWSYQDLCAGFGSEGTEKFATASMGAMACTLSHQAVWAQILQSGAPVGIVLEDDAELTEDFQNYLGTELFDLMTRHKLDVLKLEFNTSSRRIKSCPHGSLLGNVPFASNAQVYRLRSTFICASAYAITREAIEKINSTYPKLKVPVDHFLFNQSVGTGFNLLSTGFVTPAPVVHDQIGAQSDLRKSRVGVLDYPKTTKWDRWTKKQAGVRRRINLRMSGEKIERVQIEGSGR